MGAIVDIADMPEIVREVYSYLLDSTEVEPTVERNGYGRMLLTHQSDRVHLAVAFRLNGRAWASGDMKLHIDGQPCTTVAEWDMYVSVFRDPDHGRRNHVPDGTKKAVIPASRPVENEEHLPTILTKCLARLRAPKMAYAISSATTSIALDQSKYLLTMEGHDPDGFTTIAVFGRADGAADWLFSELIVVNPMGYDVTKTLAPSLTASLKGLLGADSRLNQVSLIPGGRTQGAAATNSTMVRKASVVRV